MWIWKINAGELWRDSAESGLPVGRGYSGSPAGKNDSSKCSIPCVGPIPQGWWTITGPPMDTSTHGPFVLHLDPEPDTVLFGRSGFLMHGDSLEHPGAASEGCIILPRAVREQVWLSGDRELLVIA